MTKSPTKTDFFPSDQVQGIGAWSFPTVVDDNLKASSVTAIGVKNNAVEEPESEPEPPKPPTAEAVQKIVDNAYADGFKEGRQNGYEKGFTQSQQEGHKQGLEQGLKQGQKQGLEQGLVDGRQQINQQLAEINQLLEGLLKPVRMVDEVTEKELVRLTIKLAEGVVREELSMQPEHIGKLLKDVISAVPMTAGALVINAHPDDAKWVKQAMEQMSESPDWSLKENTALSPGGCQITSALSFIDASVESRMAVVINQLNEGDDSAFEGSLASEVGSG